MTPVTFLTNLTGLDVPTLALLIRLEEAADGTYSLTQWNVPNIAQPTSAQIMAALSQPDPINPVTLNAYSSSAQDALLAAGTTINVDPSAATAKNVFVATTTQGLTLVSGVLQFTQLNPTATIPWVQNSGTVTLSADEVKVLAVQTFAFVQSTYSKKADIATKIASGAITTEAEIDTAYASN